VSARICRVLAIGAHPDDLELLCGGTLARYVAGGHEVVMAHVTDGAGGGGPEADPAEVARVRQGEARAAALVVGARHVNLGLPDGRVSSAEDDHRQAVVELVQNVDPHVILTHHPDDYHGDHREVSRLVFAAGFRAANPAAVGGAAVSVAAPIFYMDTLAGLGFEPTDWVDVSEWMETKRAMLSAHASQLGYMSSTFGVDLLEQTTVTGRFRGIQGGVTYAEAFQASRTWLRNPTERMLP
jgi:N-acetylglucosamine malate deacetylase 1